MAIRILIFEKNAAYAKPLIAELTDVHGHEVVHVNTELMVMRELTSSYFDLVIAGLYKERRKEGLRLIEVLLVEKKIVISAPIVVISDDQDTEFVQQCIKSGVADYILYPEKSVDIIPRLEKMLTQSGRVSDMLVRVATTFLGPATRVFMERQAKQELKIETLDDLNRDHLPHFLTHLAEIIRPVLKEKVLQFIHRLEQVFGVRRDS